MGEDLAETAACTDIVAVSNTREQIIDAAIDLFAKKGYEAASMREIAEAVDVSKSSLYSHFKSKDEILQTILKSFSAELGKTGYASESRDAAAVIEETLQSSGPIGLMELAWSKLNSGIDAPRSRQIWRMVAIEMCRNPMISSYFQRQMLDQPVQFWERAFEAMIEKGLIRPSDPALLAREFYGFNVYLFLKYLLMSCNTDYGRLKNDAHAEATRHREYFLERLIIS